ncbi:phosphoketolase, partial [Enterococcus sp. S181_ASV_20]|nr:phosphoketolase [Enterococcus sp. S181_ASV_20]
MEHIDKLVNWLKSYRPEELFDEKGKIKQELRVVSPKGDKRMAKNPITNGGIEPKPMKMPDWKQHAIDTSTPGAVMAQDMIVFGQQARDMITENPTNFRIFGPDETKSNRLNKVFEVTDRQWLEPKNARDEWQSSVGRVIDGQLS